MAQQWGNFTVQVSEYSLNLQKYYLVLPGSHSYNLIVEEREQIMPIIYNPLYLMYNQIISPCRSVTTIDTGSPFPTAVPALTVTL